MRQTFIIAMRFTLVTALLLGIGYPLLILGIAQGTMPTKANGSLISVKGQVVGSRLLAQAFTSDRYFHPRPSAAGNGYDPLNSGGTNYSPSNQKLVTRIQGDIDKLHAENPTQPVPIDMVTTSASGLDPEISPAAAEFQIPRVAKARGINETTLRQIIQANTSGRTLGLLGEPRVNVLELNLDLDGIKD